MAIEAIQADQLDDDRERFYRSAYGTLAFSMLFVGTTVLAYWVAYRNRFPDDPRQFDIGIGAVVLSFVVLVGALALQGGSLFGITISVSHTWRRRLLPGTVVIVIGLLAVLCALSGGATTSPFAHYLTAIGSLSIIYARAIKTRVFVAGSTVLAFGVSATKYFPPCGVRSILPLCSTSGLPLILSFHVLCLAFVSAMAIMAVTRTPQLPS